MPHEQVSLGGYTDGPGGLPPAEAAHIETLVKEYAMPAQVIVSASADDPGLERLTWNHPLAKLAANHCQSHSTILPDLIGGVACGSCWAQALRDDFVFAMENELSLEQVPDPAYVDEVAVERALAGRPADLTLAERAEVKRRLVKVAKQRNMSGRFDFAQSGAMR